MKWHISLSPVSNILMLHSLRQYHLKMFTSSTSFSQSHNRCWKSLTKSIYLHILYSVCMYKIKQEVSSQSLPKVIFTTVSIMLRQKYRHTDTSAINEWYTSAWKLLVVWLSPSVWSLSHPRWNVVSVNFPQKEMLSLLKNYTSVHNGGSMVPR